MLNNHIFKTVLLAIQQLENSKSKNRNVVNEIILIQKSINLNIELFFQFFIQYG